jgi:hypothetical protein
MVRTATTALKVRGVKLANVAKRDSKAPGAKPAVVAKLANVAKRVFRAKRVLLA